MTEYNGFGSGTPAGLSWQNDSGAYTFGQPFRVDTTGLYATKIRWFIPSGSPSAPTTGYYVGLYDVGNSTPVATAGPVGATVGAWNECPITATALTVGHDYLAGVLFPGGYYGADTSVMSGGNYDPAGPINFYTAGVFNSGSSLTYPTSSFGTPWYGVDVTVSDSPGGSQTVNLGLATETDAALTLAVSRALALGLATETDAGLTITHSKLLTLGLAAELDAALSITASKPASSSTVYVVQGGSLVACTVYTSDLL